MTATQVWAEIDRLQSKADHKSDVVDDLKAVFSRQYYLGAIEALKWALGQRDSVSEGNK